MVCVWSGWHQEGIVVGYEKGGRHDLCMLDRYAGQKERRQQKGIWVTRGRRMTIR